MKHNIPPLVKVIVGLIIVMSIAGIFLFQLLPQNNTQITASGNVEGVEYKIAPEIIGKITIIHKDLGQEVLKDEPLFTLDGMVLLAQQKVAQANVDTAKAAIDTANKGVEMAQAQYDNVFDSMSTQERALRSTLWSRSSDSPDQQPAWYFSLDEEFTALLNNQEFAKADLATAQEDLTVVTEKSAGANFLEVEKRVANAQAAYDIAIQVRDQVANANNNSSMATEADKLVADAENELNDANLAYADAMISEGASDILDARAQVQVAQTRLDVIETKIATYKTGDRSTKLELARITLEQAQAALKQTEQGLATAQANLDLANAQVGKLEVKSPVDGVIQTRNVQVGEVVNPGTVVYTILDLSQLSLTVYISEDHYGEIKLGQAVDITADSFPGKVFAGKVVRISDQAEFTPRNVQTSDGRKTTVFAIKIEVDDQEGLLKPGMPADVVFK